MGFFSRKKKTEVDDEQALKLQKEQDLESSEDIDDDGSFDDLDESPEAQRRKEFERLFNGDEEDEEYDEEGNLIESDSPKKVKGINEYTDDIIEYFTRIQPQSLNTMERGLITKEMFVNEVKQYIHSLGMTEEMELKVFKNFAQFLWSYDVLDELIDDPTIQDIKCISWDIVRVKRQGKRETQDVKFRSKQHYNRFVEHAAIKNKVSISDQNALQNFVDKQSNPNAILRFNISTKFVNSSEAPYLHIRKIPKTKYTMQQLIDAGMASEKTFDYLINAAANRDGILFTGKGASGKTTMMNFLIDKIPHSYSGLVIQENEELFSDHPDLMFQHTVMNRGEGKIQYDLKDLARNGLLVDLDYFIIGEIKGGEALYMLNAAYTGHRCWASVHGASSTEAINKLVDYIKYASDYTREEAMQMLTHINTVVFMKDFKVAEIAEVVGWDDVNKKLIYKNIPVD